MNATRLLLQSLLYYWRTHLAVLLGVIAGTAVIGGALVVGDSVRGSLRKMSLDRLGEIDHVLHSGRFFRENLAMELAGDSEFQKRFHSVAPALVMQGGLEHSSESESETEGENVSEQIRRVGKVNVYGLDQRLWQMTDHGTLEVPQDNEVILSSRVGEQLKVVEGDSLTLWIELPATVPRDSLLGRREQTSVEISLVVKAVLEEESGVGRLNLNPNQQLPLNAFVSLKTLQSQLGLVETRLRDPEQRKFIPIPARVNGLFVRGKSESQRQGEQAPESAKALTTLLSRHVTLEDLYLRVVSNTKFGYLSLESEQQILENRLAQAGQAAAKSLNLQTSPVFVYLANEIISKNDETAFSRYSIVAGVDFVDQSPFGPFEFVGEAPGLPLGKNEIVINDWLRDDLKVNLGDEVRLKYHIVGAHILAEDGKLPEEEVTFTVRGIVKLENALASDRGLTPEVKGITDVESFDDWDEPFPMKDVTNRDDAYWEQYRATPKAFVSLKTAQNLWRSRYGELTSIRVSKDPEKTLDQTRDEYNTTLRATLTPEQTGLVFQPTKYNGLQAAAGTTPFSAMFGAFSFFLILSATILIGLLFRLGIERRVTSVGLLSAVGFPPAKVRRLFLTEGIAIVFVGGLLGILAAVGYASLMVYGLKTWWRGAIGTRFLDVYVGWFSLPLGFVISVTVASLSVWWAMWHLRRLSTCELLSGVTEQSLSVESQRRRGRRALRTGWTSTVIALLLLAGAVTGLIPSSESFSGFSWQVAAFFVIGISLLVASLAFLSAWLDSDRSAAVRGKGLAAMGRLGMRNASRNRQRSVFTVGLIASATFVIVAVAAGHRNPAAEEPDKSSGNGGYTLLAESSTPILHNLNNEQGRIDAGFRIPDDPATDKLLQSMNVMAFRVKPGEDASCLNLYKTQLPTILGVPQRMIERGGFKFADTKGENPWTLLDEKLEVEKRKGNTPIPVYPVLGDLNTLQYSLHKGIGKTIAVPNEENPDYKLKIMGQFDGSVFQGVLLMAEKDFRQLYTDRKGYEYFLIEVPPADAGDLTGILETGLNDFGFDVERVAKRLDDFLAVQNTYLSTFQTLGGLGLLLGTLGLATVMLRNVLERRAELALLRAIGFRRSDLAWLVLWENAFLLAWGLLAGSASALLAMTPHLASIGADVPWLTVELILLGVFVVGMLAALFAVREAVRTPILETLRSE
ncbi:MAG: ABC transporter permease [Planctomycetes bacterium]|nr:ABC transporter permease [Planctomycetota bacterium]